MNSKLFSINLNFDSLGEAYGWPQNFREDATFTKGVERILSISKKFNIPVTFFIVGKDLENKRNFEIIKKLSDNDNIEIANHSYNHLFDFGSKEKTVVYDEIYKSHEILYKCTGQEPKGFIAPTWSISKNVIDTLIDLEYQYDTSYFQSIFLFPAVIKIFISHIKKKKFAKAFQILNRRDYLIPFKSNKNPFFINREMKIVPKKDENSILEIPMPTTNMLSPPIWHTVGFILGWQYLKKKISQILYKKKPFFYLIHPADILDNKDLDSRYNLALERMDGTNYKIKMKNLENILELITSEGFEGKKLIDIAKYFSENKN